MSIKSKKPSPRTARFRPTFWATVLSLGGIVILCLLGHWQLDRLAWKRDLIANLAREYNKTATDHIYTTADLLPLASAGDNAILRGAVRGHYINDGQILLTPRTRAGAVGYHVLTPFRMDDGSVVMVNRGWAPDDYDPAKLVPPQGDIVVPGMFRPLPDPGNRGHFSGNQWYAMNTGDYQTRYGIQLVLPVTLYLEPTGTIADKTPPVPFMEKQYPRNKHMEYAIFWFTMAGLFGLFWLLFSIFRPDLKNT